MNTCLGYLKKIKAGVDDIAVNHHVSKCWLWCDYAFSLLRHGCYIRQYFIGDFWRLSAPERRKRLTYPRTFKLYKKLNREEYKHFLDCKADFNEYFKDFIKRDWIPGTVTQAEFEAFIRKHDKVIIKPAGGVEGKEIFKFVLSGNPDADLKALYEELRDKDVLIEEMIVQNRRMVFANSSVNTIRTHTIIDRNGKAHVIKAVLRTGTGDSLVDNYCQGGSIFEVDIETGLICTHGQSKGNVRSYFQQGTDMVMLGYRIPHWDKVLAISERAAEYLPQMRFVGWDVAIRENDVLLIEGNSNPDYEALELLGSTGYYEKIKALI